MPFIFYLSSPVGKWYTNILVDLLRVLFYHRIKHTDYLFENIMYLEIFVLNLQFGPVGETGFILEGVYIGFTSMIYNLPFTNKNHSEISTSIYAIMFSLLFLHF